MALNIPDAAGGSATIPVPATPGSWALRIKANNSGPNTPARWPDPTTTPAGFLIYVNDVPPPIVVSVGASPNPANPGDTVQLTCSAAGGTGPYNYFWSLSDGTIGAGSPFGHAFGTTGSYVATCTVFDAGTDTEGRTSSPWL